MLPLIALLLLGGLGAGAYFLFSSNKPEPTENTAEPQQRTRTLGEETIEEAPAAEEPTTESSTNTLPRVKNTNSALPPCEGEISASSARSLMSTYQAQIKSCYQNRLKSVPTLSGKATLSIRIGRSGNVERANAHGSIKDSAVFNCMERVAKGIKFPAVEGGSCAQLDVPYDFTAQL